jgi:5'/3'-nucleotidase SurE
MKNLFIVNDDGVKSPGLLALIKSLERDYQLTIVSTPEQKSWTAKSISYKKDLPFYYTKIEKHRVLIVDGLPAEN